MYTCIRNLLVVVVAFIHGEHEIEVQPLCSDGCEIVVVSSLQLLNDHIWDISVQFQLQLAQYQAQEYETNGHVGVDLLAKKNSSYKKQIVSSHAASGV